MYIGHLDADCFYVSAERKRRRHLRKMAVGVLGNQGAAVIAKSYEMKAAGVKTGMAIWDAKPLCPEGVYIKRDFRWYKEVSNEMLAIVKENSPKVEFYSIDEFFFQMDSANIDHAKHIQKEILDRVGIPVSIGIAPTKLLAKLISDTAKPNGCGIVKDDADRMKLLRGKAASEVTGIASRRAERLAAHGIHSCYDFVRAKSHLIRRLLTKTGEDIWWELSGKSVLPIITVRPDNKFLSRGGSIGQASNDPERVRGFVVRNVERLIDALEERDFMCDNLTLSLSFKDAYDRARRVQFLTTTADFESIVQAALFLLPKVWQPTDAKVHYMHLFAGGLRRDRQLSLFDTCDSTISQLKHDINEKVGTFAVRSGETLVLKDIYADPANEFDICDIAGKSCF